MRKKRKANILKRKRTREEVQRIQELRASGASGSHGKPYNRSADTRNAIKEQRD